MHCETLLFYGPIGKVIFDNISYKTTKSKLKFICKSKEVCIMYTLMISFLFSHELLMSFTTQFPNSRFDIRMTYLHYYLCKRKIPEYISTTRHHSPDYITGKALKHF